MSAAEKVAHFWRRVRRDGDCWLWSGGCTPDGYGLVAVGQRGGRSVNDYAHRVSYWLTHGPIPAGAVVRHSCDNPPCCNPDHLLIGTQADNIHDAAAQGKYAQPRPGGWAVPANIRALAIAATKRGELTALARTHGLNPRTLAMIRRRALAARGDLRRVS